MHWGTFNLALHAWDEPAETLLRLAQGLELIMPKLGESVEPVRAERPEPWWRAAGGVETPPLIESEQLHAAQAAVPWRLD